MVYLENIGYYYKNQIKYDRGNEHSNNETVSIDDKNKLD